MVGHTDGPPGALQEGVSRRHLATLFGLALIWGASFMFIKVAVRELTPATLILCRLGSGALTLALIVPFVRSEERRVGKECS